MCLRGGGRGRADGGGGGGFSGSKANATAACRACVWQEWGGNAPNLRLTLISFLYQEPGRTHTHLSLSSPGHSTRVGRSARSEGASNQTLLCICQAVPATPHPPPFPPLAAILWSFKNRRWSLIRDGNTGAASSSEGPAKKKKKKRV